MNRPLVAVSGVLATGSMLLRATLKCKAVARYRCDEYRLVQHQQWCRLTLDRCNLDAKQGVAPSQPATRPTCIQRRIHKKPAVQPAHRAQPYVLGSTDPVTLDQDDSMRRGSLVPAATVPATAAAAAAAARSGPAASPTEEALRSRAPGVAPAGARTCHHCVMPRSVSLMRSTDLDFVLHCNNNFSHPLLLQFEATAQGSLPDRTVTIQVPLTIAAAKILHPGGRSQ